MKQFLTDSTTCLVILLLAVAFIIGGMLGGVVGSSIAFWMTDGEIAAATPPPYPAPVIIDTPTPTLVPTSTPVPPVPTPTQSIADVVSIVWPSVVTIINVQSNGSGESTVMGSGILVDSRGYIMTNYHVIEDSIELKVSLSDGRRMNAELIASDRLQDLAMLKIEGDALPTATWGDSSIMRPGDWVIAIGSALGDFPNSVTVGVVSGVNRALLLEENQVIEGLIQTDAAINRGNSGGPLINLNAEVVGINTFIIRESRNTGQAEGIGFAIPSNSARVTAEQWIAINASQVQQGQ